MSGEVFLLVALGGLAGFIVWGGWQRRRASAKPLERRSMERGFVPGASQRESVLFTAGLVAAAFGFVLLAEPRHPPFTGRGAAVDTLLYAWFGPWGASALCWLLAFAALAVARSQRRKRLESQREG